MGELIQTRVMRAAGFASIVRRTVFAVFSKKVNPKIIARDVALLNRQIFDELVNKGIKKEDDKKPTKIRSPVNFTKDRSSVKT